MEFYLHNKDDNKLTSAVNLATQFKIGEDNYIIYYETQVEKSSIDIFIGQISYGNQNLIISKIAVEKQNEFLGIVKDILAGKNPKTEQSDYANIIDTATIVLDSVQKIQIPTKSLDNLKKYHNKNIETINQEENKIEENKIEEQKIENEGIIENSNVIPPAKQETEEKNNVVNTDLSSLDSLINQSENIKKEKLEKKKINDKKQISTPILIMLIISIIVGIGYAIYQFLLK